MGLICVKKIHSRLGHAWAPLNTAYALYVPLTRKMQIRKLGVNLLGT
jgi:hypothetical protein